MKNTINVPNLYDLDDAYNHIFDILENRGHLDKVSISQIKIMAQDLLNRAFYSDVSDRINEMCGDVACEILDENGFTFEEE